MLASFQTQLAQSAAQAQNVFGEDFTIAGDTTTYSGVMDLRESLLPATETGLQTVKELIITATEAQFDTAPSAATRPKVTARGATWVLTAVRAGPFHYHLTCVPGSS